MNAIIVACLLLVGLNKLINALINGRTKMHKTCVWYEIIFFYNRDNYKRMYANSFKMTSHGRH
jgi:hypothetical protein